MTTPAPPAPADITTRVEQQIAIIEKMDALRRMAGGIAHDFNNVLMLIFGYCDVLMEKVHPEGPLYSYLREIKGAGEHAARLTRLLMVFSTQRVFQPVTMNLNAIVATSRLPWPIRPDCKARSVRPWRPISSLTPSHSWRCALTTRRCCCGIMTTRRTHWARATTCTSAAGMVPPGARQPK